MAIRVSVSLNDREFQGLLSLAKAWYSKPIQSKKDQRDAVHSYLSLTIRHRTALLRQTPFEVHLDQHVSLK